MVDVMEEICPYCEESKPTEDFTRNKNCCKDCWNEAVKARKYGISLWDLNILRKSQGFACAICYQPSDKLVIDHDHACCEQEPYCGKCIRGLLCGGCNALLGFSKDSISRLQAAMEYLKLDYYAPVMLHPTREAVLKVPEPLYMYCFHCEQPLPSNAHRGAKYCDDTCRYSARRIKASQRYREKKEAQREAEKVVPSRWCSFCEGEIPDWKPSTALYCGPTCSNRATYLRSKDRKAGVMA